MSTTRILPLPEPMDRTNPLPSARAERKVREAQRHLSSMGEAPHDREASEDYLSAFLSAARSVLDYLRAENVEVPGFRVWVKKTLKRLQTDDEVGFMFEKRNFVVHEWYPDTDLEGRASYSMDIILVDGAEVQKVRGGEVLETREYAPQPKKVSSGPGPTVTYRRYFDDRPDEDVVSICRTYLDRLREVIEDARKFVVSHALDRLEGVDDPLIGFRRLF